LDLLGALQLGRRSLETFQVALDVTGQNIANVATDGYTRRRIALTPGVSLRIPQGFLGTGVDVGSITSVRDAVIERQLRDETSRQGYLETRQEALAGSLQAIDESSAPGIGAALSNLFDAFSSLSTNPENLALRQSVVQAANRVAQTLNAAYNRLQAPRTDLDGQIKTNVTQINGLTTRIASLNNQITQLESGGREASDLRDARQQAVTELGRLVDTGVYEERRGNLQVSLAATGDPLVSDSTAYQLSAPATAARGGLASVTVARGGVTVDLTDRLRGGRLGATLAVRDDSIPGTEAALNTLTTELVNKVNAVHRAGFTQAGAPGGDFFVISPAGSAAAAGIAVNAAIGADPTQIAAAGSPSPGDNANAIALSEIRATQLAGLSAATPTEFLGALVARLGSEVSGNDASLTAQQDLVSQLQSRRDEVSGVSLDEEAVRLSQFQTGYAAAAKFINTIDELTKVALSLGTVA